MRRSNRSSRQSTGPPLQGARDYIAGHHVQYRSPRSRNRGPALPRPTTQQTVSGEAIREKAGRSVIVQSGRRQHRRCGRSASQETRIATGGTTSSSIIGAHRCHDSASATSWPVPATRMRRRSEFAQEAAPPQDNQQNTAVALLKSGVDPSTISHRLGHASPTTMSRYAGSIWR